MHTRLRSKYKGDKTLQYTQVQFIAQSVAKFKKKREKPKLLCQFDWAAVAYAQWSVVLTRNALANRLIIRLFFVCVSFSMIYSLCR